MKSKDQLLLEEAYQLVYEAQGSYANKGIVFLKQGGKDLGCCIGVKHGGSIKLSKDLIERIKNISNLKFVAEGTAAKNHNDEPGMMPFIDQYFPGSKILNDSWDEMTEDKGKGTANPEYNIVYIFMQHRYNKYVKERYTFTEGTMLDTLARPAVHWPKNSPKDPEKRKEWIVMHAKKAGFLERLHQKYDKKTFIKLLDDMEASVYPPKQQFPDMSTYFGKLMWELECERNQTIYNIMQTGACCFAGCGHLVELKQQFPDLEIICEDRI